MLGRRFGAVLAVVLLLVACGGTGTRQGGEARAGTVGIALPTTTSERWVGDGAAMVRGFRAAGYRTVLEYAGDDVGTQVAQVAGMIAEGVNVLVVTPVDATALTAVLRRAKAADILVLSYDRLVLDSPDVDYHATFDNVRVGVLQGTYIRDALGLGRGGGPFTAELFAGSPDDSNSAVVLAGAMSVLGPFVDSGELVVRSGQTTLDAVATPRWDPGAARARTEALLGAHYADTRLDAVLSPYDGMSRGVLAALRAAGYGGARGPLPVVTGQDAERASVRSILAGEQAQTVFKDTRELARVAVETARAAMEGQEPVVDDTATYDNHVKIMPTRLVQPVSVDRANCRQVLLGSGYYTAAQLAG